MLKSTQLLGEKQRFGAQKNEKIKCCLVCYRMGRSTRLTPKTLYTTKDLSSLKI